MLTSTDCILTTHAGSLPRPDDLIELNRRRMDGEPVDEAAYQEQLREETADVVRRQAEIGIQIPNDGEYGHAMGAKVDYGAWWNYSFARLSGVSEFTRWENAAVSESGDDPARHVGQAARLEPLRGGVRRPDWGSRRRPRPRRTPRRSASSSRSCNGPLAYTGYEEIQRDIDNMKAAMERAGVESGFLNAVGAGQLVADRQHLLRHRRGVRLGAAPTRCARSTWRSSTPG